MRKPFVILCAAGAAFLAAAVISAALAAFGFAVVRHGETRSAEAAEKVLLGSVSAVLAEGGEEEKILLFGTPFEPGSPYYTDIEIRTESGESFSPPEEGGYSPSVAAFDFLGKGYEQIFYSASTGGSGGFGYYYVFDLSDGVATLFDAAQTDVPFSARFADGGFVKVSCGGKPFVLFDVSDGYYSDMLWDENGRYTGTAQAYVTSVNYVQPSYEPFEGRCRLMLWYRVTGCCSADTAGYLVRRLDLLTGEYFPYCAAAAG